MKIKYAYLAISLFLILTSASCSSKNPSESQKKVFVRNALQMEAERLTEAGRYDEAVMKYREAIAPENINHEYEKAMAVGGMVNALKFQGQYSAALKEHGWFLRHATPTPPALEIQHQIESLIAYSSSGNPMHIHRYIDQMQKDNENSLPPNPYRFAITDNVITTILYLYDTIGDYDAGIAFIDRIIGFNNLKNPDRAPAQTSKEAIQLSRPLEGDRPNPNRRRYEIDAEYLKIREAFEQDKAEGKQGSHKEGKPGRATLALIQSDYFPL